MISLKQLTYALAVEKTLHFKSAAQACYISQSALSTGLSALEKQLGLQIFERDNKKVLVTPLGKIVLEQARNIVLQANDLQQLANNQSAPLNFPLSLGIIPTVAPFLLPKIFPRLTKQFPQARLNIVEEQSQQLVNMVRHGDIDSAILALPFSCDGLITLEFAQEDFYWISTKDDPLAQQAEISSAQLQQSHLMLLKEGHCLKAHILDICKLPQQTANHGFAASSLNTLVQMVLGKIGTTLIPQMALEQLVSSNKNLRAIHLNEPSPHRRLAFIMRPNYTRLSSIEALVELSKKSLN